MPGALPEARDSELSRQICPTGPGVRAGQACMVPTTGRRTGREGSDNKDDKIILTEHFPLPDIVSSLL